MTIQVTVLGGFLGAGKTTALNALLREATAPIAVLVNDFGAIPIDAALIAHRAAGLVALTNGCVCCALGPDLGAALAQLTDLDPAPAQIVIEASGVSDPWRIAQLVRLEEGVHLDAVLVLVDAQRFPTLLADPWLTDTLERQLARADLAILTHTDLATPAEREATETALHHLRPTLPITSTTPASALLNSLPLGEGRVRVGRPPSRFTAEPPQPHTLHHATWRPTSPIDHPSLLAALAALPPSVLRVKGFLRLEPGAQPHLVQRAGTRVAISPWPGPLPDEALVLIGTAPMTETALDTLCLQES